MRHSGWKSLLFLLLVSCSVAYKLSGFSSRLISNRICRSEPVADSFHNDQLKTDNINRLNITARAFYSEQRVSDVSDWNKKIDTRTQLQREDAIKSWNDKLKSVHLGSLVVCNPYGLFSYFYLLFFIYR